VIVDTAVREVRRHAFERPRPAEIEKLPIAGGIELQQRRAELKTLRPFGPPARRVLTGHRKYGRTVRGIPRRLDRVDLRRRQLEQAVDFRHQVARLPLGADVDHRLSAAGAVRRSR